MRSSELSRIVGAIAAQGHAVAPHFLSDAVTAALRARAQALDEAGMFAPARVGRGAAVTRQAHIRGDRICWLGDAPPDTAEMPLHAKLEALRAAVNRELQLGLVEFEGHYAIYPAGAGYARHRDRFRDDDARVLSIVLYLNDRWSAGDGGALRLFVPDRTLDVVPEAGTLVALLSERVEHEVLPAARLRMSIAGWLRRRS